MEKTWKKSFRNTLSSCLNHSVIVGILSGDARYSLLFRGEINSISYLSTMTILTTTVSDKNKRKG